MELADEVVVETAAAAAVGFADSAGSAVEVEVELVDAAGGFELAATTWECLWGERSAFRYSQHIGITSSRSTARTSCILFISEGRQRKFPHDFALFVV